MLVSVTRFLTPFPRGEHCPSPELERVLRRPIADVEALGPRPELREMALFHSRALDLAVHVSVATEELRIVHYLPTGIGVQALLQFNILCVISTQKNVVGYCPANSILSLGSAVQSRRVCLDKELVTPEIRAGLLFHQMGAASSSVFGRYENAAFACGGGTQIRGTFATTGPLAECVHNTVNWTRYTATPGRFGFNEMRANAIVSATLVQLSALHLSPLNPRPTVLLRCPLHDAVRPIISPPERFVHRARPELLRRSLTVVTRSKNVPGPLVAPAVTVWAPLEGAPLTPHTLPVTGNTADKEPLWCFESKSGLTGRRIRPGNSVHKADKVGSGYSISTAHSLIERSAHAAICVRILEELAGRHLAGRGFVQVTAASPLSSRVPLYCHGPCLDASPTRHGARAPDGPPRVGILTVSVAVIVADLDRVGRGLSAAEIWRDGSPIWLWNRCVDAADCAVSLPRPANLVRREVTTVELLKVIDDCREKLAKVVRRAALFINLSNAEELRTIIQVLVIPRERKDLSSPPLHRGTPVA